MNQKILIQIIALILVGLFVMAPVVLAQADFNVVKCGKIQTDSNGMPKPDPARPGKYIGECDFNQIVISVIRIVNYLLAWAWLVALLFIMWASWNMVISGGDSEKITGAKSTLNNAIVGFFLVTVSFILLNFVVSMFTNYDIKKLIDFLP